MKEQTEEKMINNRIIEAARRYASLKDMNRLNSRSTEWAFIKGSVGRTKISKPEIFYRAFGITEEDYPLFLQELVNKGYNIEDTARLMRIDATKIKRSGEIINNIEDIVVKMDNGNKVAILGYHNGCGNQEGRFLTGVNPNTGCFALVAKKDHQSHLRLAEEQMPSYQIIEGGFLMVSLYGKSVAFEGFSESFNVYGKEISKNLIRMALPDWEIYSF